MVDQLRTATNEHFAGVQKRQVSLGMLASVLERVQKLGINSGQPGQILRVELVTFTLVGVDEVELSGVCDQDFMSAFFEQPAHPGRMSPHLDGDLERLLRIEPAPSGLWGRASPVTHA